MKFKILLILSTWVIVGFSLNPIPVISQERPSYEALVAKAKSGDPTVDFRALRYAYTETPYYRPYGEDFETQEAMFEAFKNRQFEKAIQHAAAVLERNYVDIDTHFVCGISYGEMKNGEKFREHQLITKGLINSILSSGDGLTPETAFVVINVREEYIVLSVLGLKKEKQSLIESNGHRYDRIEAIDLKTHQKAEVYFNVDLPYHWLTRKMKK